jgi:hypothetical protein
LPARDDLTILAVPENTYVLQFYYGKENWEQADALSTLPGSLEEINITLHEPPENGIAGQIFDELGSGIFGLSVSLYSESLNLTKTTQTDTNGIYDFRGINPASDYQISVWSPDYQTFVYYHSESSSVTNKK